jgi:hypothetical protein
MAPKMVANSRARSRLLSAAFLVASGLIASAQTPGPIGYQMSLLTFMTCFRVVAWMTLAAVPLLLFVRRFKPAGKARTAH